MKWLFGILAMATVATATAADDARAEVIWSVAHNRAVRQLDGWFDDGDYPRCIQALRLMHALDPEDYTITTDLGWMYGNVQEEDKEIAVYEAYRKMYPNDPEAQYPLAEFYYFKKQWDKVPPLIEHTLARKPHPNSYRILAHSYEHLGKLADAKRIWDKYLALYPKDGAAIKNRERVVKKLKAQGAGG